MKRKKLINVIVGIIIVFYIIFKTDAIGEIKNTVASVSNSTINETKAEVSGDLFVYFIDVGQADSILIRNNGKNMLIDAGNNADGKKLVDYFKSLEIEKFDYVVATHPHEDHIGGMDDIINNFKIDNYYMPDKMSTTKTFEDVLDSLINNNLKYDVPLKDEEFDLGDSNFKVIYAGDETNDINDSSIVLKLRHGNNTFLLTGDATSNVEKTLLNEDLKSDVLKIAHHGSDYSTTDEFLNKVDPKYAVVSVGSKNSYGHPASSTLKKLDKKNIKLYRTDLEGTIIFKSDGENINVETIKTDTNG